MRVAILDDYQNVALTSADWSPAAALAEITVFTDHVSDPDELVERSAFHPRLKKPMRIIDLAFFVAEHDDYHLAKITAAKRLRS